MAGDIEGALDANRMGPSTHEYNWYSRMEGKVEDEQLSSDSKDAQGR